MSVDIDMPIFRYFASPPEGVHLPTKGLVNAKKRRLSRCLVAVFNEEHWARKRGHTSEDAEHVDMQKPFDATQFNFNKADPREIILRVNLCGSLHPVLANISPLMMGHTVVALWAEQELPQGSLGKKGVHCMFELAAASKRTDFRVVYNSLGAFASVNHLHVHGLYAGRLDGVNVSNGFPIESASQRLSAELPGGVKLFTLSTDAEQGHYVNGFVLEGPLQGLPEVVGDLVERWAALRRPYNLLVRLRPTPACFLLPRRPQECFDVAGLGCNAAVSEMCGYLVMQSSKAYEKLTVEAVRTAFLSGASLPADEFERLAEDCCRRLRRRTVTPPGLVVAVALGVGVLAVAASRWMRGRSQR